MNCKNCKSHCAWVGTEGPDHEKCFVGYMPQTNADRIRSMTDEELADFLTHNHCALKAPHCMEFGCTNCWLDWLRQEAQT